MHLEDYDTDHPELSTDFKPTGLWELTILASHVHPSVAAMALQLDRSHHLIDDSILQLAEEEVPPEDVVFHRFTMNWASSSKKLKAKKKGLADDEDTDLFDENEEEEEDEIDNMLEDDEDLLGHGSDADDEHTSDAAASNEEEEKEEEEEDGDIEIWGADTDEDNADDSGNGNENPSYTGRKKRKDEKKSRPSPFASLEDFEHLMAEDRS
ncbi:hypothetical protein IEQ34_016646 [Dendrobium chrysotoxum]|uniref:Uncharacterized protein n=1 Tax=Dendrobium chrysotoxum TaxID=161865 RepID=A0AAV7GEU4_DENCH|nr:hypothetical protein IEQ34_016646 [Dendrobium chrysotoxum]